MDATDLAEHVEISVSQDITIGKSDSKVRFLRVAVNNLEPAVQSIIEIIADTSWVVGLVDEVTKQSFLACAEPTIQKLSNDLKGAVDSGVTSDIGEYVVSVVARYIIEAKYSYKALPLAEIIKEKVSGNPGFDYHHEKDELILIFGEAKYLTGKNAHNSAFKQVVDFIKSSKDMKEVVTLSSFLSENTKTNLTNGKKGFSMAFSTSGKSFNENRLIELVEQNTHLKSLIEHEEIIVVAVDIND